MAFPGFQASSVANLTPMLPWAALEITGLPWRSNAAGDALGRQLPRAQPHQESPPLEVLAEICL